MLLVKVTFSDFVISFSSETKMTNDLKFKTRETATTTSLFYTRRHREHFDVLETTEQGANYRYTLTKSTNRKYNEKCYKYSELWQGQSRIKDHVHGMSTSNIVTHKSRCVSLR